MHTNRAFVDEVYKRANSVSSRLRSSSVHPISLTSTNETYETETPPKRKKRLSMKGLLKVVLAFLIDQIQKASCGLFQRALNYQKMRRAFWEQTRGYYIEDWRAIFDALKRPTRP